MSFDLHLQHFSAGDSAATKTAPVLKVLSKQKHKGPDEFGYYRVEFVDGVHVEFNADGLKSKEPFTSCAFNIRGISLPVIQFVFDVACAGNFVIFNCQGEDSEDSPVLIQISPDQESQLPEGVVTQYANRPICESAKQLGNLLFVGYDEWQKYRDKVVKKLSRSRQTKRSS
ncbi:MAG: hypothetical protein QM703_27355 [Gemmatales bacterium]